MAKKWTEVAASDAFKSLSPDQQDGARRQYFDQVVAPRVPEGQVEEAWNQFSTDTGSLPAGVAPSTAGAGRGIAIPQRPDAVQPKSQPAAPAQETIYDPASGMPLGTQEAQVVDGRAVDDRRTRAPGRLTDADIPDATPSSVARDVASGVLQIGPTAVKGIGELARLATGDRIGKGLTDAMDRGNEAIQDTVGSERGALQRKKFSQDMQDPALNAADVIFGNPGAMADQVLPTVGSMALPVGAAGAAGKLATTGRAAQLARAIDEGTVLARANSARQGAVAGTTVAQNAAGTFSDIRDSGGELDAAYTGAAVSAPFSYVANRLTGGAAEASAASMLAGTARGAAKEIPKAMLKEGGQEVIEEAGQYAGETIGKGEQFDSNTAGKRMAVAGTLGAVMGGGVEAAGAARAAREARIKTLRDAGETAAADLLQQKHEIASAAEDVDAELNAMPGNEGFAQQYRTLRSAGVKPAEAAARSAVSVTFQGLAQQTGVPEKALQAAMTAAKDMPLDKVPGFFQKFTEGLAKRGLIQPSETLTSIGTNLETARDEAMDAAIGVAYQPVKPVMDAVQALEKSQNPSLAPGNTAQPATDSIANANQQEADPAAQVETAPVEAPAAMGSDAAGTGGIPGTGGTTVQATGVETRTSRYRPDMQTGQLLRLAKMESASEANRQAASAEVKRREVESMYAGLETNPSEREKQEKAILEAARDEKVDQAVALSSAQEVDAPSAMKVAFDRAKAAEALKIAANQAATSPLNDLPEPTQAQKEAGNYKVGRITLQGLNISIENPQGSVRKGTSPDGSKWENTLAAHYGYIRGTEGNDGDHVDTFIGPNPASDKVFVVDQVNKDGTFDEHKVMLGADNLQQADKLYHDNYHEGWTGRGAITEMSMTDFKKWVKDGIKTQPVGTLPKADKGATQVGPAAEVQPPAGSDAAANASPVYLGRDNTPLTEGGKAFKTRKAADDARKLNPMMRVVRADGGYALTEKTAAQLAAQEKAAKRLRNPQTSAPGEPIPAHAMIASAGGLSPSTRADMGMQGNVQIGNRKLFAGEGKGLSIEQATEKLVEEGYLSEGASHDNARDLIKRSLTKPQYNAEGYERLAELDSMERFDAAQLDEDEAVAEIEALSDNQLDALLDADIPWDASSNTDIESAMRALGFTEQEIQDAITNQSGEPQDGGASRGGLDEGTTSQAQADSGSREEAPPEPEEVDTPRNPAPAGVSVSGFDIAKRADGTLAVKGDAAAIRKALNGIPAASLSPMRGGILVGRTQADKAMAILQPAELTAPTKDDVLAQQERADKAAKNKAAADRAAEKQAAEDEDRKRIAKASEAAADTFELGGDAMANLTGQKDIFTADPVGKREPTKIEDFGEKIAGARKDYSERLQDAQSLDVAAEPLSKTWPEPDYQKLLDAGTSPWVVAFVHTARDAIPTKPKQSWKLKQYVSQVKLMRDVASRLLSGEITEDAARTRLMSPDFSRLYREMSSGIQLYQLVGHAKSLKGVEISRGEYTIYNGVQYDKPKVKWTIGERNHPFSKDTVSADTEAEALKAFKAKYESMSSAPKKGTDFIIWSSGGKYHVGKKIGRDYVELAKPFDTVADARQYRAENQAELESKLERYRSAPFERSAENQPRIGDDHRNGASVTPEVFTDAFGFRGVQFGNYVEGTRRQLDLNNAYDSLSDLAAILNIPTRAISLNGQLGLAFGARGKGGKNPAAAHYEPNQVVINLTKNNGAGALAHEWFHALDNYFAKMDGGGKGYVTDGERNANIRPEMVDAFKNLMATIRASGMRKRSIELDKRRSSPYWATNEEMAARAFESYIINKLHDQNASNDYLANVVGEDYWKAQDALLGHEGAESYPYPTQSEIAAIGQAFDRFFNTIQTKETDKGTALFALGAEAFSLGITPRKFMPVSAVQAAVDELAAKWVNGPKIKVVQFPDELPIDAPNDARGLIHKDTAYVVATNHVDRAGIAKTLAHEAIGHYGLWKALGKDGRRQFEQNLQLALKSGNKPLNAIAARVRQLYVDDAGKFNLSPAEEANEIAAFAVEEALDADGNFKPGFGFFKQVWAKLAEFLRGLGFDIKFTNAELQGMLVSSLQGLEAGQRLNGGGEVLVAAARSNTPLETQEAIIGNALGAASQHPDYAAAKSGDVDAALRVAGSLMTPDLIAKVKRAIGRTTPVVVPVVSVEATGHNKIPLAAAAILAKKLGLKVETRVSQSNSPKRTALDGLDRLFTPPVFDGEVAAGESYLLVDDTLTQGATFAALESHIRDNGGSVVGAVALTGKQYSATLKPSTESLKLLRDKFGDIENDFQASTGYGFDALTQSEVRYLTNFKPADTVRAEIVARGNAARSGEDQSNSGQSPAFARGVAPGRATVTVWNTPDPTRTDKIIYELQDGRIDLKRVQQAIEESGQQIEEKWDARLAETLYPGRVAHRSQSFLDAEVKPLLKALAVYKVPMDELADYLHARGAEERNAQVAKVNDALPDGGAGKNSKGVLMTNQAARDYLANIPADRKQLLDVLAAKVDAITAGTRKLLVDEGLEKQETIDAWMKTYKNYVPMFRDEAQSGAPHPQGSGFTVKGSASKRATGSTKEVTNILAHVLMQREAAITRAEKNRVALSLYGQALSHPNPEFWTTIKPSMTAAQIGKELQAMGVDPMTAAVGMETVPTITTVDEATGKKVDRPNPLYKSLPGAIPLKVNGEDRVLMINVENERGARLAENLKNLDGLTKLDLANTIIGKSTRWLASVNTQYNPAFGLVNLTRDTLGAVVNLGSTQLRGNSLKVLANTPVAIYGIARELARGGNSGKWQTLYRQFQEDGGQTGYKENFRDAGDRAKAIERELVGLKRAGTLHPGRAAHAMLDLLDGFNTTLENAVRVSAYAAALDNGISRAEAARLGRELTVDFNRKGRAGREVGPLYAFFNASVQGSARTIQTLKGPSGAKIIAGGLGLGALQALMLLAAGYDDDEVPEFVKTRALVIPMNWTGEGEKTHVLVPYPLGLHVIPNTGRVISELALNGGKNLGKRTFEAVGELAGAFNPLGGGNVFTTDGALKTIAPTLVDPLIELGYNRNFAGNSIERASMNGETDTRPGAARAKEATQRSTTGQAYIGISKAINSLTGGTDYEAGKVSPTPERLRYIAQTVGGGVLREIEKTINASTAASRGEDVKSSAIPVLGRFYGEVNGDQVKTSRYFDNAAKLDKLETTKRTMTKAGDAEALAKLTADHPEIALIQLGNKVHSSVVKLNKIAATTIGDVETMKELDATRVQIMDQLNQALEGLEKETQKPTLGDKIKGWKKETVTE